MRAALRGTARNTGGGTHPRRSGTHHWKSGTHRRHGGTHRTHRGTRAAHGPVHHHRRRQTP
ncbi:hypothetical protein DB35_21435 [Streptomyces abyssalis]|uniref:Uncharacterized protein n=1 Tax=Streptomyces abyssalis TaxID=933944 RepID=A0A1E7JU94_9ACTN|nr:hypothetical protein DB35_21435 [Streptomyces abyssalis]OEU93538.1 hypothetical protein AN215_01690 [Streptomyces abyssalis]OEV28394.1 hypothetical protein AN219_20805 [Streptomyces nanshensis]